MAICNPATQRNSYFFADGFNKYFSIESLARKLERMTVFYISRNNDTVIFRDNNHRYNIGTFGGVVFVNSANFFGGTNPVFISKNERYLNNFAYFGGGAFYAR